MRLILAEPADPILSSTAEEIKPKEVASPEAQGIIDGMLELSTGKGHSKEDSRQMSIALLMAGVL